MRNRKSKAADSITPGTVTATTSDRDLADLRRQIIEIREFLVQLLHHHGYSEAGMRGARISLNHEKPITLEEAAKLFWGKSVAKNPESLRVHAEILQSWTTKGLGGRVLEANVRKGRWYTSREAVERFEQQLGQ